MRLGKASYLKDRMMCAVRLGREFSLKSMIHTAQTGPLQRPCKTPSVEWRATGWKSSGLTWLWDRNGESWICTPAPTCAPWIANWV
jgi:hypothetical protein